MRSSAPTDQRAGVRPIAFALDTGKGVGSPVTLKIRPEDLTRTEPSRIAVHQTLGRDRIGWGDDWGAGLPTVTIAGHTGWQANGSSGEDGVQAFEKLNSIVMPQYHAAKQAAINSGLDPSTVKLLFIDMLDNFTWSVSPTNFVLRRSKSRPLLMQYNISLQALAVNVDNPFVVVPFLGNITGGLSALSGVVKFFQSVSSAIQGWVATAISFKDKLLAPVASTVAAFSQMSNQVFQSVYSAVSAINGGVSSYANSLISIAADIGNVGKNVFRSLSAIAGIPQHVKYALARVSAAYNEVVCIFSNSLRPRKIYQDFDGLFGASNCSSTTGGRPASRYADSNVFAMLQTNQSGIRVNGDAQSAISGLGRADPVLVPLSVSQIGQGLQAINGGVSVP